MMNCDEIRDHLEAYSLDALDPDTKAAVEKHLSECADCRRLAEEYAEIAVRLPEAVAAVSPLHLPDAVKTRLFQRLGASPAVTPEAKPPVSRILQRWRFRPNRIRFQHVSTLVLLAMLVISILWIGRLNTALALEQSLRAGLETQTELIFEVVDSDQTTRHFLQPVDGTPRLPNAAPAYGKIFIRANMPYVIAMTGRLPPPPAGQVYNLWLSGQSTTTLAGSMMPDDAGFGTLVYQAEDNGPTYRAAQLMIQEENSTTPDGVPVLVWQSADEN